MIFSHQSPSVTSVCVNAMNVSPSFPVFLQNGLFSLNDLPFYIFTNDAWTWFHSLGVIVDPFCKVFCQFISDHWIWNSLWIDVPQVPSLLGPSYDLPALFTVDPLPGSPNSYLPIWEYSQWIQGLHMPVTRKGHKLFMILIIGHPIMLKEDNFIRDSTMVIFPWVIESN